MAAMSACFLLRFGVLAVPFVVLNALMVPAILIQGGHNLADVIGGLVVFAIAYRLAGAALRQSEALQAQSPSTVATSAER
jgi:uncharacterized membrane protein